MKSLRWILLLITLVGMLNSPGLCQEINLQATVDRHQIGINEQLTLSLTVSGQGMSNLPSPQPPRLTDFDIVNSYRSQNFSIINGQFSAALEVKYVLVPRKPGKLIIPSATLAYKDKTYQTQPITIEVTGAARESPIPSSPQQQPQIAPRGNLFLEAAVDKRVVYVNEQVTLQLKFFRRLNLWQSPIYNPPEITGFWTEDLPVSQETQRQVLGDREYLVHEIMNKALFPTSEGEYTIGEATMNCVINPFQGAIPLRTQPVKIKVLPLPSGKPAGFSGAVGRFEISAAIDKRVVEENQPVTLTIKLKGQGNINAISQPELPQLIDFKQYESGQSAKSSAANLKIEGEKTYTYILVPISPGLHTIGEINFSYFSPSAKCYKTARTQPIRIRANPGASGIMVKKSNSNKQEVQLLKKDIQYIKESPHLANQANFLYRNGFFWLLQVLPLFWVAAGIFYKKHLTRLNLDPDYARQRRAYRKAKRTLTQAKILMNKDSREKFYTAISRALSGYLGDKLNLLPTEIVTESIEGLLKEKGVEEEAAHLFYQCLQAGDYARFAPSVINPASLEEMLRRSKWAIERAEKSIKKPGLNLVSVILLAIAVSFLPAISFSQDINQLFNQANQAYKQGNFPQAIQKYQGILNSGFKNAEIYYNLANSYLKNNQPGQAILFYERAKRLLPGDEDVQANLDYANSLIVDKIADKQPMATKYLLRINSLLNLNEQTWLLFGIYFLLCILILVYIFVGNRRVKNGILGLSILAGLFFIISFSGLIFKVQQASRGKEAVITHFKVEVKSGPKEDFEALFFIHEGTKVEIKDQRGVWQRISLIDGKRGWIKEGLAERI